MTEDSSDLADRLELRPIEVGDEPFLCRLYASTRAEELAAVPWSEEQKRIFLEQQFAAQHKFYREQFTGARFDLLLLAGEPVGRLYVDRRESEIRIIDIALLPEARGRGLGGRLLGELIEEGGASGRPVRIHVERNNPALGLYRRLGFVDVEDQGVYLLLEKPPLR